MATLQIRGLWAREKDQLNMDSNSYRAKEPGDLRENGSILSGPAFPLLFTFLMVYFMALVDSQHMSIHYPLFW